MVIRTGKIAPLNAQVAIRLNHIIQRDKLILHALRDIQILAV